MKNIVYYSIETGKIEYVGSYPDQNYEPTCSPGMDYLEVPGFLPLTELARTHWVENGILMSLGPRPSEWHNISNKEWVFDALAMRSFVSELVGSYCKIILLSGFRSCALGDAHHYDSDDVDQLNLLTAKIAGNGYSCRCTNSNGVRGMHSHTKDQLAVLFNDWMATKTAILGKCYEIKDALASSESYDEISSIANSYRGDLDAAAIF